MPLLINTKAVADLRALQPSICELPRSNSPAFAGVCDKMFGVPRWAAETAIVAAISSYFGSSQFWLLTTVVFLIVRGCLSDLGQRCIKTLPRDLTGIVLLIKIQWRLRRALRRNLPIHHHFLSYVRQTPEKECVVEVETGRSMNFRDFNSHANKYANYFKSESYRKDEVVALFLENGIEFFASWLGLSKLGVITAWINTNLKLESLAHSLKVSNCKAIITSRVLFPKLEAVISKGLFDANGMRIFVVDGKVDSDYPSEYLSESLEDQTELPIVEGLDFQSILCFIYTSGTTGHPKAAIIRHYRYFLVGVASGFAFQLSSRDRIYITLPMYHSAGGILGIGNVVVNGATAVIRSKFSASNFWRDCIRFNCSASQYIGEICRYLLAQKPNADETCHHVRVMYGNGLRPQIWREFSRRFRIKKIGELYGSTEGNSNILNLNSYEGSCGFIPIYPFIRPIYPVRLVKVDEETGELVRDPLTGLCVACEPGDTGEMVGKICADDPLLRFEGYVSDTDTNKKVIRDVMHHDDMVFSSGDVLYWDRLGYLYFKDRRGDTFRWKGENCATTEIEGVVQPVRCIIDATVYGVEVPHYEGKAGMIAVSLAEDTDAQKLLTDLAERLSDNLAAYAIPVFLRICKHVDRTGTFKLKKTDLQREGFNPVNCDDDPLFYWNSSQKAYLQLDERMLHDINNGIYTRL